MVTALSGTELIWNKVKQSFYQHRSSIPFVYSFSSVNNINNKFTPALPSAPVLTLSTVFPPEYPGWPSEHNKPMVHCSQKYHVRKHI